MAKLERILVVEDAPDVRMVVRLALERLGGFEVRDCGSGAEALELVPEFLPQLIVLDVMMPQMDGPTTLRALRGLAVTVHTPVVYMTAKSRQDEREALEDDGVVGVIFKPFNPRTLAETVREAWANTEGRSSQEKEPEVS